MDEASQLKNIRMIGLDLDGTALNSQKVLTPAVQAAIAAAGRAGIAVLPATGRGLHGVPPAFLGINTVRRAVTVNGAVVWNLEEKTVLWRNSFEPQAALDILAAGQTLDMSMTVFIGEATYSEPIDIARLEGHTPPSVIEYIKASRTFVPNLAQFVAQNPLPVDKFSILFPDITVRNAAIKLFAARGDCHLTSSFETNLELNTPGTDKGAAMLRLGQTMGIGKEQIMAVGDGMNDMEMLQAVGWPVAMGNAIPQLKEKARFVTASCDEDGVAVAINKVLAAQGLA